LIRHTRTEVIVDKEGLMLLYKDFVRKGFGDKKRLKYIDTKYGNFNKFENDVLAGEILNILNTKILNHSWWKPLAVVLLGGKLKKPTAKERREKILRDYEGQGFQWEGRKDD
jgi:hypothetical protein